MIAFYIMGLSTKTFRNARFVDSTDSIIEKIAVIMRTAIEEKEGLKRYYGTFLSFLIWSIGLQIKRSQNYCDGTKRSILGSWNVEFTIDMVHSEKNIDSWNVEFTIDLRNIRITMSTDGMNLFMNNSMHSTWPIVLMILILPPCLCNKQEYIMMSGLISGPRQPGNDIDTYFRPLVEDLKVMWYNDGVQVWDEHKR
jgi:hypothetical protein